MRGEICEFLGIKIDLKKKLKKSRLIDKKKTGNSTETIVEMSHEKSETVCILMHLKNALQRPQKMPCRDNLA